MTNEQLSKGKAIEKKIEELDGYKEKLSRIIYFKDGFNISITDRDGSRSETRIVNDRFLPMTKQLFCQVIIAEIDKEITNLQNELNNL